MDCLIQILPLIKFLIESAQTDREELSNETIDTKDRLISLIVVSLYQIKRKGIEEGCAVTEKALREAIKKIDERHREELAQWAEKVSALEEQLEFVRRERNE